jgi:hypothetical protein
MGQLRKSLLKRENSAKSGCLDGFSFHPDIVKLALNPWSTEMTPWRARFSSTTGASRALLTAVRFDTFFGDG